MKYTYIIVFVLLGFILTGCFAKPSSEEVLPEIVEEQVQQEEVTEKTPAWEEEEQSWSGDVDTQEASEEDSENTQDEADEENEDESTNEEVVKDDQEVIEEYEQELEELFNDILGE